VIITGFGHKNIRATHPTTIAFTKDKEVTPSGDCFVAVGCDWQVTPEFLARLRSAKKVTVTIECCGHRETVTGTGHPSLTLAEKDLVIRTSGWVDARTLMIGADKPARALSKELVQCLKQPGSVRIRVDAD